MKAAVLTGLNLPLEVQEFPTPSVGPNEVLIRINAASLNHRDIWIQKGLYAGIKYPVIAGSDGSGTVESVGESVDRNWVGKEVIINPSHNWGVSEKAQQKTFQILGLPDYGTFAEYAKVSSQYLLKTPDHLSFEQAAALPLAGLTAYRALFSRAKLQAGEKLFITGIGGGVALFALQFGIAIGAEVYVNSGDEHKIEKAKSLGAKAGVNYKNENWVDQLKEIVGGFDVIVDGAAGKGFLQLLELALPGGRIVNYGATQGDVPSMNMRRIFWKQLNILGSTMGSPADFQQMADFVSMHGIEPIIDEIFDFTDAEKAMQKMNDAKQFGKIVLKINNAKRRTLNA
jgi:zinc-binding alcohol dehydrogenase/oxidoreductase